MAAGARQRQLRLTDLPDACVDHIVQQALQEPHGSALVLLGSLCRSLRAAAQRAQGRRAMKLYLCEEHLLQLKQQVFACSHWHSLSSLSLLLPDRGSCSETNPRALLECLLASAKAAAAALNGQPLPLRALSINSNIFGTDPNALPALLRRFPHLERLEVCVPTWARPPCSVICHSVLEPDLEHRPSLTKLTGLTALVLRTKWGDARSHRALLPTTLRSLAWEGSCALEATPQLARLVNLRHLSLHQTEEPVVKFDLHRLPWLDTVAVAGVHYEPEWFAPASLAFLARRLIHLELAQVWAHDMAPLLHMSALTSLTGLRLREQLGRLAEEWWEAVPFVFSKKGWLIKPKWFPAKPGQLQDLAGSLAALPSLKYLRLCACKGMKPLVSSLSNLRALQQLHLDSADAGILQDGCLESIQGLTYLGLTGTNGLVRPAWHAILQPLTRLVYLQVEPRMLAAGAPTHTWLAQLTRLHTLALTRFDQLPPPRIRRLGCRKWTPTGGPADELWETVEGSGVYTPEPTECPPNTPWLGTPLLREVAAALQQLAPSVRRLLLHRYLYEGTVEALRAALPPGVEVIHELHSDWWLQVTRPY